MACLRNSLTNKANFLTIFNVNLNANLNRNFSITNVYNANDSIIQKENLNLNLNTVKHGTGGRSSTGGNCVTVFGASGMMGRILVNRLGKEGNQVIVPFRGDIHELRSIKLAGDLGQIYFQVI
jgi:hypothetical protein